MELEAIINELKKDPETEKVANDNSSTTPAQSQDKSAEELSDALKDALKTGEPNKQASAEEENPVEALMKMASEMSSMDKEAEEATVRNLGIAFADSAHRRWNELNEKVGNVLDPLAEAVKIAAMQGYEDTNTALGKQATLQQGYEDTDLALTKQAALQQGYSDANATLDGYQKTAAGQTDVSDEQVLEQLVKHAEAGDAEAQQYLQKIAEEYEAGSQAALQMAHKVASEEFLKGAAEVQVLLNALREQQQQQQ